MKRRATLNPERLRSTSLALTQAETTRLRATSTPRRVATTGLAWKKVIRDALTLTPAILMRLRFVEMIHAHTRAARIHLPRTTMSLLVVMTALASFMVARWPWLATMSRQQMWRMSLASLGLVRGAQTRTIFFTIQLAVTIVCAEPGTVEMILCTKDIPTQPSYLEVTVGCLMIYSHQRLSYLQHRHRAQMLRYTTSMEKSSITRLRQKMHVRRDGRFLQPQMVRHQVRLMDIG